MIPRIVIALIVICTVGGSPSYGQAKPGQVEELQIQVLQLQVIALQNELAAMKADAKKPTAGKDKPPVVEVKKPAPVTKEKSNAIVYSRELETVYKALELSNVRVVDGPFAPGDNVMIAYDLKNTSGVTVEVPITTSYPQPLAGVRQHWIERDGEEDTIPAIPARAVRVGRRYGAGGSIIPCNPSLSAGEIIRLTHPISTKDYPPGSYTVYIEYKRLPGDVLESRKVSFQLQDKTAN